MKLKNIIAVAAMAAVAAPAFALSADQDLTSKKGNILVKNSWGECVKVNANQNLTDCGAAAPAPAPEVETVVQTEVITLDADTYFAFDKYHLKPTGKQTIQNLAQRLQNESANIRKITVDGYTDHIGSDAYNQRLSQRRAETVANYLVENGVNPGLIEARGHGKAKPHATTAEGRARNRRVDITIDGEIQRQVQQEVNQ